MAIGWYYVLELTLNSLFFTLFFSVCFTLTIGLLINIIKFIARGAKLPSDWRKRDYLWVQVVIGTSIIGFIAFLAWFSGMYLVWSFTNVHESIPLFYVNLIAIIDLIIGLGISFYLIIHTFKPEWIPWVEPPTSKFLRIITGSKPSKHQLILLLTLAKLLQESERTGLGTSGLKEAYSGLCLDLDEIDEMIDFIAEDLKSFEKQGIIGRTWSLGKPNNIILCSRHNIVLDITRELLEKDFDKDLSFLDD